MPRLRPSEHPIATSRSRVNAQGFRVGNWRFVLKVNVRWMVDVETRASPPKCLPYLSYLDSITSGRTTDARTIRAKSAGSTL